MSFNFPNSPLLNDSFAPVGGPIYIWNGSAWVITQASNAGSYTKSEADAKFVDVAGDTMTGNLIAPNIYDKTTADGLYVDVAGDTMTGALTVGGDVTLGTGNIIFPAANVPSANVNALDDYERGNWTPIFVPGSGAFTAIAYARQYGRYVKVGRAVHLIGSIMTNSCTVGTAAGQLSIGGLPFTVISDGSLHSGTVGYSAAWTTTFPLSILFEAGAATLRLYGRATTVANSAPNAPANIGGGVNVDLYFFGIYLSAS